MGKFVARTFRPGDYDPEANEVTFATAWEAWDYHRAERFVAEAKASGKAPEDYVARLYSVWGDMNELAEPDAYDNNGLFQVASAGDHWYLSKGTGLMWGRTPGRDQTDVTDCGICYQVDFRA